MDDERCRIVGALRGVAENAFGFLTGNVIRDVSVAPGCPDVIHCECASHVTTADELAKGAEQLYIEMLKFNGYP